MKLLKKIKKKLKNFFQKIRNRNVVNDVLQDDYINYYIEDDYDYDYEDELKKDDSDEELSDEDIKIITYSLKRDLCKYTEEEEICSICLCKKYKEVRTFVCSHTFCQDCIIKWYIKRIKEKTTPFCPLCMKEDDYIEDILFI